MSSFIVVFFPVPFSLNFELTYVRTERVAVLLLARMQASQLLAIVITVSFALGRLPKKHVSKQANNHSKVGGRLMMIDRE